MATDPAAAAAAAAGPPPIVHTPPAELREDWVKWFAAVREAAAPLGLPPFYLTTAINYTNGVPHMGHAYEALTADVVARYNRLFGRPTFFLTGTDEHGQKIANAAAKEGLQPIQLCDRNVEVFRELNERLHVSEDFYIRTSMPKHYRTVDAVVRRAIAAGDIYLGEYEGWYNEREETFVTELDAKQSDYLDPVSKAPLKKMSEKSYFFRMSKYQDRLRQYIEEHPDFIQPVSHRNLILLRLSEPLQDLSVSRTTFSWGVPFPDAPEHVVYVWFDALTNYLTGVDVPEEVHGASPLARFWPASVQIIGKDITWFHCVIWPCMLMSVNLPLPHTVFAHGFVTDRNGQKMSKSLGNVVDPLETLKRYQPDTFRMYLIQATAYGDDLPFREDTMQVCHDSDLNNDVGNLLHRLTNLVQKMCEGVIPDVPIEPVLDIGALRTTIDAHYQKLELHNAYLAAIEAVRRVNGYLNERAPWKNKDEDPTFRRTVIRSALEALYASVHFLAPVIPDAARKIFHRLGTPPTAIALLREDGRNLTPGTPVTHGDVLFEKFIDKAEKNTAQAKAKQERKQHGDAPPPAAPAAPADAEAKARAKQEKKEKLQQEKKEKKEKRKAEAAAADGQPPAPADAPAPPSS